MTRLYISPLLTVLPLYKFYYEGRGGIGSGLNVRTTLERDETSTVKNECLESLGTKDLYQILERKQWYYENNVVTEEAQSLQDAFKAPQDQNSYTSKGSPSEVSRTLQEHLFDHRFHRKINQQHSFICKAFKNIEKEHIVSFIRSEYYKWRNFYCLER